jgi:hypothetical protein
MVARARTLVDDPAGPDGAGRTTARLRRLVDAGGTAPGAAAHERLLPAVPAIASLLPDGGLRRGTTITVAGSTSLALALAVGPSGAGSWCAVVGAPALGLVAAAELGVTLERFPLIAAPARTWTRAVATALEAFDLVLAWPPVGGLPSSEARRLTALGRERGSVLVTCGGPGWPVRTDLRLEAVRSEWVGLDRGHGRLRARRLDVVVTGRGSASMPRRSALWLPSPDGGIASAPNAAAGAAEAVQASVAPAV